MTALTEEQRAKARDDLFEVLQQMVDRALEQDQEQREKYPESAKRWDAVLRQHDWWSIRMTIPNEEVNHNGGK